MKEVAASIGGADWLTPVATLLAVFVGGLLAWWTQSRLALQAARREVAARRAEAEAGAALSKRLEDAESRAAARVVQADLSTISSRLQDIVEKDPHWYGFYTVTLPHWKQEQRLLAKALDQLGWDAVSQSAWELDAFDDGMRLALAPGGPHAGARTISLSVQQTASIEILWDNATAAWNALAPLAGVALQDQRLHG
ncbi:MAG: hypothetical protein QOJ29_3663 [Thermoleophilaceae bacterium]|jgi:hypothetical protein|nr:hypothetical protein [Thermoleophilaceae bacterium]